MSIEIYTCLCIELVWNIGPSVLYRIHIGFPVCPRGLPSTPPNSQPYRLLGLKPHSSLRPYRPCRGKYMKFH